MSQNDMEAKIVEALNSYVKTQSVTVQRSSQLREELGLDSMDTIELVFQLEDNFNIQISDDDLMGFKTVDDVVKYVEKRVNENKGSG